MLLLQLHLLPQFQPLLVLLLALLIQLLLAHMLLLVLLLGRHCQLSTSAHGATIRQNGSQMSQSMRRDVQS